jgi:hypothetical protein
MGGGSVLDIVPDPEITPDIKPDQTLSQIAKKRGLMLSQQESQKESSDAVDMERQMRVALKGVKMGAAFAPFALAAPFTGGLSLGYGALAGAGEGLASGFISEGLDTATGEPKKTASQLAKSLAWDTVLGIPGEALKPLLAIGGKPLEEVVIRTAAKSAAGDLYIKRIENAGHEALQSMTKDRTGAFRGVYQGFRDAIAAIPRATKDADPGMKVLAGSPVGGNVAGIFDAVTKSLEPVIDPLTGIAKELPLKQSLDVLIRAESNAMQMAFDVAHGASKASTPVSIALTDFATGLRNVISKNLSPAERRLFEATKDVTKARMDASLASTLGEQITKKAVAGAIGAAVGAVPGAAGAIAAEQIVSVAAKRYAPAALKWLAEHDKLGIEKAIQGLYEHPEMMEATARDFARKLPKALFASLPVEIKNALSPKPSTQAGAGGPGISEPLPAP